MWNWSRFYKSRKNHYNSSELSIDLSPRATHPAYTSLEMHHSRAESDVAYVTLRSALLSVTVDRLLKAEDIEILFDYKIRPWPINDHYRAVRDVNKSHRLCGWATFDLEESTQSPRAEGTIVRALHISTLKHIDRGFQLGYFFTFPSAFYVLFVRNIHDNVFERIGMGCLYGMEVDKAIKEAESKEVVLI